MKSNRRRKQTARSGESGLSRREFARGATVAAAAIAAIPGSVLGAVAGAERGRTSGSTPIEDEPKLSAEAEAEAEANVAEIVRRYGSRLDEAQKADIRRLVREGQAQLEALRAFPLANSDEPATILRVSGAGAARRAPAKPSAAPKAPGKSGA